MSVLIEVQKRLPVRLTSYQFQNIDRPGFIIIDEVNGFCKIGAGPLAPEKPNAQIEKMIAETNVLAKKFSEKKWPILMTHDSHDPDKPEYPYPPHCVIGSEEEEVIKELKWLESYEQVTIFKKDCMNGFIGASHKNGENDFLKWVEKNKITHLVFVGICTDICVLDFVLTILSVRNHGLLDSIKDIIVHEPACATFDIDEESLKKYNLPVTNLHPQDLTHHMGIYLMASRGAIVTEKILFE